MRFLVKLLLVALFSCPCTAFADQSKSSTEIPVTIRNSFEQPFLVGEAPLKFWGMKVYDISLWSEGVGFSYNKNFAIRILYNMNFTKSDLVERSLSEIKRLHTISADEELNYAKQLQEIFRNVKKGDEKVAHFSPSQGVTMYHNNQITGKISSPKLARLFVDIWLDEKGSYPKVIKRLLGRDDR